MRVMSKSETIYGIQVVLEGSHHEKDGKIDCSHPSYPKWKAIANQIQSREGFEGIFNRADVREQEIQLCYVVLF